MSLPYRQQWQLRHIDNALRRSDPHLAAMLAIFARLTAGERTHDAERLRGPAWWLMTRLLAAAAVSGGWVLRQAARVAGWITTVLRGPRLRGARPAADLHSRDCAPPPDA